MMANSAPFGSDGRSFQAIASGMTTVACVASSATAALAVRKRLVESSRAFIVFSHPADAGARDDSTGERIRPRISVFPAGPLRQAGAPLDPCLDPLPCNQLISVINFGRILLHLRRRR